MPTLSELVQVAIACVCGTAAYNWAYSATYVPNDGQSKAPLVALIVAAIYGPKLVMLIYAKLRYGWRTKVHFWGNDPDD